MTVAEKMRGLGFKFEGQMGGGCSAWMRLEPDGGHVLVTVPGGGRAPEEFEEEVVAGWYSADPARELPERWEEGTLGSLLERGVLAV